MDIKGGVKEQSKLAPLVVLVLSPDVVYPGRVYNTAYKPVTLAPDDFLRLRDTQVETNKVPIEGKQTAIYVDTNRYSPIHSNAMVDEEIVSDPAVAAFGILPANSCYEGANGFKSVPLATSMLEAKILARTLDRFFAIAMA